MDTILSNRKLLSLTVFSFALAIFTIPPARADIIAVSFENQGVVGPMNGLISEVTAWIVGPVAVNGTSGLKISPFVFFVNSSADSYAFQSMNTASASGENLMGLFEHNIPIGKADQWPNGFGVSPDKFFFDSYKDYTGEAIAQLLDELASGH